MSQSKQEYYKISGIHFLDELQYKKAMSQMRMQVGAVMEPLRLYGQGIIVDGAIEEVMKLVEDFGLRVRGRDKPISIDYIRRRK